MIVDTSALVAVVLGEPDAETYAKVLTTGETQPRTSAVSLVESAIVVEARQGADAARDLDLLIETCRLLVEPVTHEQALVAVAAWQRFGKGRHPAGLNLGDCFSYALARLTGEPLLFKGGDFSQTDIAAVR